MSAAPKRPGRDKAPVFPAGVEPSRVFDPSNAGESAEAINFLEDLPEEVGREPGEASEPPQELEEEEPRHMLRPRRYRRTPLAPVPLTVGVVGAVFTFLRVSRDGGSLLLALVAALIVWVGAAFLVAVFFPTPSRGVIVHEQKQDEEAAEFFDHLDQRKR